MRAPQAERNKINPKFIRYLFFVVPFALRKRIALSRSVAKGSIEIQAFGTHAMRAPEVERDKMNTNCLDTHFVGIPQSLIRADKMLIV